MEQQVRLLSRKEGVKGGMVMMTKNDMGRGKKVEVGSLWDLRAADVTEPFPCQMCHRYLPLAAVQLARLPLFLSPLIHPSAPPYPYPSPLRSTALLPGRRGRCGARLLLLHLRTKGPRGPRRPRPLAPWRRRGSGGKKPTFQVSEGRGEGQGLCFLWCGGSWRQDKKGREEGT